MICVYSFELCVYNFSHVVKLHNTLISDLISPSYTVSEYENLSRNYSKTVFTPKMILDIQLFKAKL